MTRTLRRLVLLLACGPAVVGCTAGRPALSRGAAPLGATRIVYDLDAAAAVPILIAFRDARPTPESAIAQAAHEPDDADTGVTTADGAPAAWTEAGSMTRVGAARLGPQPTFVRLRIERPSASGPTARALVELYERRPADVPASSHLPAAAGTSRHPTRMLRSEPARAAEPARPLAAYALEISAAEAELIVRDLRRGGLFAAQERPRGGARVTIGRGDEPVRKEWTPEPRLDDLIERVLRDGQPASVRA